MIWCLLVAVDARFVCKFSVLFVALVARRTPPALARGIKAPTSSHGRIQRIDDIRSNLTAQLVSNRWIHICGGGIDWRSQQNWRPNAHQGPVYDERNLVCGHTLDRWSWYTRCDQRISETQQLVRILIPNHGQTRRQILRGQWPIQQCRLTLAQIP